jgi:hypothetical protein
MGKFSQNNDLTDFGSRCTGEYNQNVGVGGDNRKKVNSEWFKRNEYTLTGKKNGTLISQQQIIPIIPILMYFDQEAMIANITLNISIGYFISNFA